MREYLYIEQLDELTPWTREAIETMVRRGVFERGVHYFQPAGRRGRLIFKWSKIVDFIEQAVATGGKPVVDDSRRSGSRVARIGSALDVEKATTALQRLLD